MDFLLDLLHKVVYLDDTLRTVITAHGAGWAYLLLFSVVFMETGLVVFPFLPGDSLLFLSGFLTAITTSDAGLRQPALLDFHWVFPIFVTAAICGDSVNYWIGRAVGPAIFRKEHIHFINKKNLEKAHQFYEKHGGKTVAIGRFMPIIRTFVPFVAGIAKMHYARFLVYSILGTLCWVSTFVLSGRYFGEWLIDKLGPKGFTYVVMAIILISLVPAVVTFVRGKAASRRPAQAARVSQADRKPE